MTIKTRGQVIVSVSSKTLVTLVSVLFISVTLNLSFSHHTNAVTQSLNESNEELLLVYGTLDSVDETVMPANETLDPTPPPQDSVNIFLPNGYSPQYGYSSASQPGYILRPSNQGWELFGIAWYWWLAMLGVGYGSVVAFKKLRNTRVKEPDITQKQR